MPEDRPKHPIIGLFEIALICLTVFMTVFMIVHRLCQYAERTTWKEVDMAEAQNASSGYWQGLAEAREEALIRSQKKDAEERSSK